MQCLRRDDITQFFTFGAFDFDITLINQPFKVPVDSANRHTELGGKGGLGYIRIAFNILQQRQFACGI